MPFITEDNNGTIVGYINSNVSLLKTDNSKYDVPCSIVVINNPYGIEYVATINPCRLYYSIDDIVKDFKGNLDVYRNYVDDKDKKEINGSVELLQEDYSINLLGYFKYNTSADEVKYINGNCTINRDNLEEDNGNSIECTVAVPILYNNPNATTIKGYVDIKQSPFEPTDGTNEIYCTFTVDLITTIADLDGAVITYAEYQNTDLLGWLDRYLEQHREKDIDGSVTLAGFIQQFYIYGLLNLSQEEYIYGLWSKVQVVDRIDFDLGCSITVDAYNRDIIRGEANVFPENLEADIIDGSVTMDEYKIATIFGLVTLDNIYTRREFIASLGVVGSSSAEFISGLSVVQPNYLYNQYLPSKLIVGYPDMTDMYSTFRVINDTNTITQEFRAKFEVINHSIPVPKTRIVIAVDPLWNYEPYVLKNAINTFFNRLYRKYTFDLVYGGNPRSDYDIKHLAHIYGVDFKDMNNVPLIFNPQNPSEMQCSINNFLKEMFTFPQDRNPKTIARVILFADGVKYNNVSVLRKIYQVCKMKKLPCVIIHSDGQYIESSQDDNCSFDSNHYDIHMDKVNYSCFGNDHHDAWCEPLTAPDKDCYDDHKFTY